MASTNELEIINSSLVTNSTQFGGAFYAFVGNKTTILGSAFSDNYAAAFGGAIYQSNSSTTTVSSSDFLSNTTSGSGGAIANLTSSLFDASDSTFIANRAAVAGAIYSTASGKVTLRGSTLAGNSSQENGGGVYLFDGSFASILESDLIENRAQEHGAGLYVLNSSAAVTGSHFHSNTTVAKGAAIHIQGSEVSVSGSDFVANAAGTEGGAIHNDDSNVSIANSRFFTNMAGIAGGALFQDDGATTVNQSCFVYNSDVAVVHENDAPINAQSNWWGAPDGPAGVARGAGDSVSANVDFANFLNAPVLDCAARTIALSLGKEAAPGGTLQPGQPLTFTLDISYDDSNNEGRQAKGVVVSDPLPAPFVLTAVIDAGVAMTQVGNSFALAPLSDGDIATIRLLGRISETHNSDLLLVNSATLAHSLLTVTATAAVSVVMPVLNFSAQEYSSDEASSSIAVTLTLTPANPHADVTVQLVSTETTSVGVVGINGAQAVQATQAVTIAAGSSSQTVDLAITPNAGARTIALGLQSPAGAKVGAVAAATLTITGEAERPGGAYLPKVGKQ